jgi:hypothetical protein
MRLIPSDPDLATIVGRIRDGSLDLQPDFQRGSVWSRSKQRLLIDSILRSWYVPPIHVVRTPADEQIVLDGQQRLRSIIEFVDGGLRVEGHADPYSDEIEALNGLRYAELPANVQRRFDRFTLRLFEVIDYEPEEPYELFYRLNQPTTLTSAEKRNAFFGTPREQIIELTRFAESVGMTPRSIGFSNARLAYEDLIARLVWTLESGTLAERVTAVRLTERYRTGVPFGSDVIELAHDTVGRFFAVSALGDEKVRLNKAIAHSWLCFVARGISHALELRELDPFVERVETARNRYRRGVVKQDTLVGADSQAPLLSILDDRATARVNDAASVILRDCVLWILYVTDEEDVPLPGVDALVRASRPARNQYETETALLEAAANTGWDRLTS